MSSSSSSCISHPRCLAGSYFTHIFKACWFLSLRPSGQSSRLPFRITPSLGGTFSPIPYSDHHSHDPSSPSTLRLLSPLPQATHRRRLTACSTF